MDPPTPTVAPVGLPPRPVTMEEVHRLIGALVLELELLRRDNARLRADLLAAPDGRPV